MMRVRSSVVTTEKPVAMKVAACMAASAMPSTGASVISRAAIRPGSPKQAITAAVKFNDDCYRDFPDDRGDFQKCIDDAVDRARGINPQYSEETYRAARYWVMYYMK